MSASSANSSDDEENYGGLPINTMASSTIFDFIEEGDIESVMTCLNMATQFSDLEDIYGCNAIVIAILAAKFEILQILIPHCKNAIHDSHSDGSYPLHFAVAMGSIKKYEEFSYNAVKLLLEAGEADPVVFDDFKRSPLFVAASYGLQAQVVQLMNVGSSEGVEIGKDVLTIQDIFGNTVLGAAAFNGSVSLTKLLLEACPEALDVPNLRGDTPLHIASRQGNVEVAMYLVSKDSDKKKLNAFHLTPSQVALKNGFVELAKLLNPDNIKHDENHIKLAVKAASTTEGRASLKTLVMNHELCLQHYTCPFPIRRSTHPPPENVRRLEVLLNTEYGTFHASSLENRLLWNENASRVALGDVLRVHDYQYVRKIQQACSLIPDDTRLISTLDGDTAISHHSYEAALRAAGSVIDAVHAVTEGKVRNAFCAIRPPGHHAGPSGIVVCKNNCTGSHGFCLLNNVAIAAAHARNTMADKGINRVAILDFDVHHGNGTEAIVRNVNPNLVHSKSKTPFCEILLKASACKPWKDELDGDNIFFASVHGYGGSFYPGSGASIGLSKEYADENIKYDQSLNDGGTIDYFPMSPLSENHPDPKIINLGLGRKCRITWRKMWRDEILAQVLDFKPDLIFISAGFDGHKKDEINGGMLSLLEEDYYWLTREIVKVANTVCNGRVVSVLEGGYRIDGKIVSAFSRSVASHLYALSERGLAFVDPEMWRIEGEIEENERDIDMFDEEEVDENELNDLMDDAREIQGINEGGEENVEGGENANIAAKTEDEEDGGNSRKRRRTTGTVDYVKLNAELDAERKKIKLSHDAK